MAVVIPPAKWGMVHIDPIPPVSLPLGRPEPVAPAYVIPDATGRTYGDEYVWPPHVPGPAANDRAADDAAAAAAAAPAAAPPPGGDADGDVFIPAVPAAAAAAVPPGGDPDGDADLGGGQRGGGVPQDDRLIEDAAVPTKTAWPEVEQAIASLPTDRAKYVLSGILRKMATWGLPNLKNLLQYNFRLGNDQSGVSLLRLGLVDGPGPFGETALMQAAANGRVEAVQTLIEEGANVNAQNNDGETALMWAAAYNETKVIELLLAARANPNLKDNNGFTALMVAAWTGNEDAVRALKDVSKREMEDKHGFTAADLAANDAAPAKARGVQMKIRELLPEEPKMGFAQRFGNLFTRKAKAKGGKKTRRRQKTKQKKRSRR